MGGPLAEKGPPAEAASLLGDGNCWKTTIAGRFGWLVDGENYFRALRASMEAAEREIVIVGWDIDSQIELVRDEEHVHYPSPLAETLQELVERKASLEVFVLSWDFAFVYLLERELLPAYRFGWQERERLHFHLDGHHASGASHHQKLVVIDGTIAYIGGLDLTKCRWDSRDHAADDPRRVDTGGNRYRPFHDVQAIVEGEAAGHIRELAAMRWRNATGTSLPEPTDGTNGRSWPEEVAVRGCDVRAGLSRTWAMPDGSKTVREIERLYLDMIAAARRSIYIENQYFTSPAIADALGERLTEPDGPEVLIVLPAETSGWLEQATMEMRRNQLLQRLQQQDEHDHLRVVAPVSDELGDTHINVHAKVTIVDDTWCRIGSANLSCRSMGLDSECDLVVEDPAHEIPPALRADLIAEHLGAECAEIEESIRDSGLFATLSARSEGPRRLERVRIETGDFDSLLEPLSWVADMEKPVEGLWNDLLPITAGDGDAKSRGAAGDFRSIVEVITSPVARWVFLALLALGTVAWAIWAVRDMQADFDPFALLDALRQSASHPLAPLAIIPVLVLGSIVIAPITGMIALCALLFDPWVASLSAIAGTLAATAVNYYLGMHLGKALEQRVPQSLTDRMRSLGKSADAWSLAGLRLIPIAPFTIVNLLAGASHVNLRDFLAGTLLGMGPGIVFLCLGVDRARAALSGEPVFDPWIVAAIILTGLTLVALRFWQNKRAS